MGADIDQLNIKIEADAQKAHSSVDTLISKLGRLNAALGGINTSNLTSLSNGIQRLSSSMQSMKSVGAADFTRVANGLKKMGELDASKLAKSASAIHHFTNSLSKLDTIKVTDNVAQIGQLANGIKQLGYKSSTQAIENIPKLATAMRQLMTELSKAPKVSQNLIQMTEALARLSRTGASSGRAATSLGKALDSYTASTHRASKGSFSLSAAIGKVYATYWLIFRAFNGIKNAIDISSDLTEVQNVVDVTFGNMSRKVEEFAKTSIEQFGMSELSLKQYASRFQAMGSAMGISGSSIGSANSFLNKQTKGYIGLSNSMADVSLNLTKLTADMASFYNVEQSAVAEDLASVFTGQTRPLRQYGLDLTEATLKEWALKNGLDSDIKSMSQAEKTMLRYQYVMANTGAAQGDFARTANTWANQVRILKQNFEQLGAVVGGTLINAFKPLVQALNSVMGKLISFAETVSNALGKIFGWKYESGSGGAGTTGLATDMEDAADSAGDIAGSTGKAAKNIDKMKNGLRSFDELKTISEKDGSSGSGSGSGGSSGGAGASGGSGGQWTKQDSIFEGYKSSIDSLYGLGEYIGNALKGAMDSIKWNEIYEKARVFGSGLASFLNGLFEGKKGETLLGKVGKTIAGTLNTVINASLGFTDTFDFEQFGLNLADSVNQFFNTFDFAGLADAINGWVNGLEETIKGFLENVEIEDIIGGLKQLLGNLELDTITVIVGALTFKRATSLTMGKMAEQLLLMLGGSITIQNLTLTILSIIPKFSGTNSFVDTVLFQIASLIDQGITDAFKESKIGSGILEAIGGAIAGAAVGGVAGSWFPGVGTVAGAIVGAITGAFANIEIDGSSILQKIVDKIFNFDTANFLMKDAAERLKKAFGTEMIKDDGSFDFASFGKNFVLGIGEGIVGALSYIVEPIKDLFDYIGQKICEVFGIHSPAKNMEPYGENIFLGIIEGWKDKLESFSFKNLGEELLDKIKSGIQKVKDNVLEFKADIKDESSKWWGNVKDWWEKRVGGVKEFTTNVKDKASEWWSNAKAYWEKKVGSVKNFTTDVKDGALTWWNNTKTYWGKRVGEVQKFATDVRDNSSTWWSNAKSYWSKRVGNVKSFTTNVKDTSRKWWSDVQSMWNRAKGTLSVGIGFAQNALTNLWTTVKNFFSGKSISIGANSSTTKKAGGGAFYRGSWHPIAQYAAGGFPNHGSMFVAGEAGAELVGHIGGRTEVLNQSQLASTMYSSVLSAMETALKNQRVPSQQPVVVYLDGKIVYDNVRSRATDYFNRTGKPAFPM